MHCVHTVSGVEMKLWIGPRGELDKELVRFFSEAVTTYHRRTAVDGTFLKEHA